MKDPALNKYYWKQTGAYQGYLGQTESLGDTTIVTTRDYYPTTGLSKSIVSKKGTVARQNNTYKLTKMAI